MSKLNAARRNALPDSAFALPDTREYPVQDHGHAVAALSRVAANGTPEEKTKVRAAVRSRFKDMAMKRKGNGK